MTLIVWSVVGALVVGCLAHFVPKLLYRVLDEPARLVTSGHKRRSI